MSATKRRRKLLRGLGIAGLLLVAGLGIYTYHPQPALPDLQPFLVRARDYDVTIARDSWGVPTVLGPRDVDGAFGLAYAHGEDDWETIQTVLLATRGRLAERDGPKAVPTDVVVHLLKVWETVDEGYATRLSPKVRALCEAYADGLNAFAARHPQRVAGGLLPVRGQDVVAGFVFKTPFFYGLDRTLGALLDKDRRPHLALSGKTAWHATTAPPLELGSNAFAIAPQRSGDGTTRLVVNSHQPFTGPVAWWEARILTGEGWEVAGGFFPGSPFMLHGHNRRLGWAATVNQPDLIDVYVLDLDPRDPKRYRLDGVYQKMETRKLKIPIHLFGPFAFPLPYEVDFTVHGPVVRGKHASYAVRYAGQGEVRHVDQYYRLNRAQNREQWLDAMRLNVLPSINFTYADADGNIGYVHNAMMPRRKEGIDWTQDLPGDRSDLIWSLSERVPFDALPQLWNPPSGAVFNANNTPLHATDGPGNLQPAAVPATFGIERRMTNRALRAEELLRATPIVSRQELLRIKFDDRYAKDSRAAAVKAEVLALPEPTDPVLREARRVLAQWDLGAEQKNPSAAIGVLTVRRVLTAEYLGKETPVVGTLFEESARWLMQHFGRIDVPWGEVNRLRRGALDLPLDGAPDTLRAVYGELADDGHLHATVGDSLIMVVEWPKDGAVRAESVHQFGAATLQETSSHYADQAPLFATQRFKPVPFAREAVLSSAASTYRPGRE
jgi:penicillin amidase/acyl-homoserine-lactone acylase